MNYDIFYNQLFRAIEQQYGAFDKEGIFHIIGFDCGGPLNFSTIGYTQKLEFATYVSCELAVRAEQIPSSHGRFEFLCHSNDENWVSVVLTSIGSSSLEASFDHLHTIDVSGILPEGASLTGAVIERFSTTVVDSEEYSILRVHGVTLQELEFARKEGGDRLLDHLKSKGVYPLTDTKRSTTI
jgi:hypothetical protein